MGLTGTKGAIAGYAGAVVLAAAALAVRWLLDPWLGDKAPLVAGLAAVLLLAWNIGRGPALLALAVGAAAADFLFISPRGVMAGLAHAVHQQDGHAGLPAAPER